MPTTTHPNEHAAKVAAKWWLQARNRLNIAGEAIAIHIATRPWTATGNGFEQAPPQQAKTGAADGRLR